MSTEMRDGRPVRTYRGRSLEELIPKIRSELGPDAIILREREGLTGGFNGFFQQRCVEVDAQAAAPAVDFYDEDDAAHPDDVYEEDGPDAAPTTEFAAGGGEPVQLGVVPPSAPEPAPAPPTAPPPPAAPAPAAAAAGSGGWPHERVQAPTAAPEPPAAQPAPSPYAGAARSYTETPYAPQEPAAPEELSFAQRLAQAREEREAARWEPDPEPEDSAPPIPTPPAPEQPAAPAPEEAPARGNLRVVDDPPSGATVTPIPSAATPSGAPRADRPPATLRPFPSAATGATGGELDNVAAGAIAHDLTAQGISQAWAHELIVTAAAHLTPFTPGGDLRAAVRAVIAGGIMAPPPLPSAGAAVAFVGPGGSGKSRCSAALASAYRRASTLQTRVISLGAGPRAADVAGLLAERDIQVDLLRGAAAADAIARGRERGLVVVDTDTTSPVDSQGVAALADTLAPLGLDAIYLTLPATMSAPAARGLLDGLEALAPSALVITHADEAHELGIVAELAYLSGLPIAFIHGGLNLDTALVATDPAGIAARVLP